ncbi:hypothetical protein HPB50_008385 [Hyalomma asiaticum]|uniref:Uncharacterized protein n=1 Tax=Hyalomma asiaticum TaxID=266040 RepID=A0ACB7RHV0_HYAAI|nr:hypothetical protein HPB50_008385 [Hyalomma asiaticum]
MDGFQPYAGIVQELRAAEHCSPCEKRATARMNSATQPGERHRRVGERAPSSRLSGLDAAPARGMRTCCGGKSGDFMVVEAWAAFRSHTEP